MKDCSCDGTGISKLKRGQGEQGGRLNLKLWKADEKAVL